LSLADEEMLTRSPIESDEHGAKQFGVSGGTLDLPPTATLKSRPHKRRDTTLVKQVMQSTREATVTALLAELKGISLQTP